MFFAIEETNGKKEYSIDGIEVSKSEWESKRNIDAINLSECKQYINKDGVLCLIMPTPVREITINLSF